MHLPLSLMNTLNITDSAVFQILDAVFPKDLLSDYLGRHIETKQVNVDCKHLIRSQEYSILCRVDKTALNRNSHSHAYQSLACETAISTEFSELFSLKRIFVKYRNAILSLIDCFFRT